MSRIAAHLIVGGADEPFLGALLESLDGVADLLIVNENSGRDATANLTTLRESRFAQAGKLVLDRAPFVDFAHARNRCLDLHREHDAGAWAAFVDADEVHGEPVRRIAANLDAVPIGTDYVDAYTRHYFQSFDWYKSIERRMMFFRVTPAVRWEGAVHEHLTGLSGRRMVLPYVYAHYGHTFSALRHAQKGVQYSSLGAEGETVAPEAMATLDTGEYFGDEWELGMRTHSAHPPAARATIARLRAAESARYAEAEARFRGRRSPFAARANRAFWRINYDIRWMSRYGDSLARRLLQPVRIHP